MLELQFAVAVRLIYADLLHAIFIQLVWLVCINGSAHIYGKRKLIAIRCALAYNCLFDREALLGLIIVRKVYLFAALGNSTVQGRFIRRIIVFRGFSYFIRAVYVNPFKDRLLAAFKLELAVLVRHVVAGNHDRIARIAHVIQRVLFIFVCNVPYLQCKRKLVAVRSRKACACRYRFGDLEVAFGRIVVVKRSRRAVVNRDMPGRARHSPRIICMRRFCHVIFQACGNPFKNCLLACQQGKFTLAVRRKRSACRDFISVRAIKLILLVCIGFVRHHDCEFKFRIFRHSKPGFRRNSLLYGQVPFGLIAVRKLGHASSGRNVAVHAGFILYVIILRILGHLVARVQQNPVKNRVLATFEAQLAFAARCKWRAVRYLRAVCVIQFIFFVRVRSVIHLNRERKFIPVRHSCSRNDFFDRQPLPGLVGIIC